MTSSEIYERILTFWLENIQIADGVPTSGDGWYSATLSRVLDEVECGINHEQDTWGSLMVWTMFQVFHAEAERLSSLGSDTLFTRNVARESIEAKFHENLQTPEWSHELAAYQRN
jgi:hypothetical protein